MSIIQPLSFQPSQAEWESWMMALVKWAQNLDNNTAGLPVTKQGIDNLMRMSASTSNALLMYYVATLPTAGSFNEQVVYNGEDGRIYVWNASQSLWLPTGATAFNQLSGFVDPSMLQLGNQLDMCTNGSFTNDTVGQAPNGWSTTSSYSNAPVTVVDATTITAGSPTPNVIALQGRDTYFLAGNGFDVKPSSYYFLEGYFGSDGSTPGMGLGLYFPAVGSNGPSWVLATSSNSGQTGWAVGSGLVQVPSWASRAKVWLFVNSYSSTPSAYGNNWFTGIECVKASSLTDEYPGINQSVALQSTVTVQSGSFTTGYATFVHCEGYVAGQGSGGAGLDCSLVMHIDGSAVDYVAAGIPGVVNASVPFSLIGTVTAPGSHSVDIQVTNSNSTNAISVVSSGIKILNLLR